MDDNNIEVANTESTEIVPERGDQESVSIRRALEQQYTKSDGANNTEAAEESTPTAEETPAQAALAAEEQMPEAIPLVPPADMNKWEKEAYLNPTPANAHILQQYLNRRAYETRSDYQKRMQEVESLKQQTSGIFDTIKQYEQDYAKQGISMGDIARRSVAWDRAMQSDPVTTAMEWLDSYGLSINDLMSHSQQPEGQQPMPPSQPGFLTREEAEKIAEDKLQTIQTQQQQKAVEYYNQRVVQSFMSSKPVFRDPETASQLEADMTPVVAALTSTGKYSSPEEILETAYNYVINGNPTYSSIAKTMTAKPEIKEQQAAVAKAKAASRSISGSPGSGTPKIQAKNLRDNLQRRFNSGE
jgi:hypothetical protein